MSGECVLENKIKKGVCESVKNVNIIVNNYTSLVESQIPPSANIDNCSINMSENKSGVKGVMKLSDALDNMSLAYNPITKQLHFVCPKVDKQDVVPSAEISVSDGLAKKGSFGEINGATLSKKDSFSDEGNYSLSTCDKSDSDSPKGTLRTGHHRSKDGGSFSSTISSLSEYSLSGSSGKEDAAEGSEDKKAKTQDDSALDDSSKAKKKGLSAFFSRGVFPWKSGGAIELSSSNISSSSSNSKKASTEAGWRLFGRTEAAPAGPTPSLSVATTPQHRQHRRQGSTASDDLVASSIALIQHDRPSNLPAKCSAEAGRHRLEHERVVAAARRRSEREAAMRRAKHADAIRHEDAVTRAAHEWNTTILADWDNMKSAKRTQELWWLGLPPSIRGRVWQLAIGNQLNVTTELYHKCVESSKLKLEQAKLRRQRLKIHKSPNVDISNKTYNVQSNCKHFDVTIDKWNETNKTENSMEQTSVDMNYGLQMHRVTCHDRDKLGLEKHNITHLQNGSKKYDVNINNTHNETEIIENGVDEVDHCSSHSHNQTSLHRNFSEQNLKSKCIDCSRVLIRESSRSNPNLCELGDECSMELIELDIARTFPHLCIFQPGGPYFDVLHELLAAYVCYRPDIGYVQGMSFVAAILILNMEAPQAFVCFANLMNGPVLKAAFTRDGAAMQRLWNVYEALLQVNVPALAGRVGPELYLLEWLYTAFAKAMPLDAACHVWDVFLRDGDQFLFRAALGVLHLYQDALVQMDFISAAQFLTKLPEDLSSEALFRSISLVQMQLSGRDFVQLVDTYSGPTTTLQLDQEEIVTVEDL